MKRTEYSLSLQPSVAITQEYNVAVNSEEISSAMEYLIL
jgi:hypothetical protein